MIGPGTSVRGPADEGAAGSSDPERPLSPGRIRFPALDGCRALAAFGVLVTHVGLLSGYITRTPGIGPYLARMDVGVSIFFVLSGFLLYRPLVAARFAKEPTAAVGPYARRRLLRIVPAYWVALTIVGFVLQAPGFHEPHSIVAHYLLLQVYDSTQLVGGPIQQSWSLATEVAFYVFVPCWAWLMSRRSQARADRSQLQVEVLGLVALFVASMVGNLVLVRIGVADSTFAQLGTWLPFRIGDFVPGMLLAVASAWISHKGISLPRWTAGPQLAAVCWVAALGVFWFVATQLDLPMFPTFTPKQAYAVRLLYVVFAALIVVPAVFARQDRGPVARVFANPLAIWLGLISYGIYIWHEAWQDVYLRITDQPVLNANFLGMMAWTVALTLVSAAVSWYVVERPAIRWGSRPRRGGEPTRTVQDPPSEAAPARP